MKYKLKRYLEKELDRGYKGSTFGWDSKDNPTLIIPDCFEDRTREIIDFTENLWIVVTGGEMVQFHLERAIKL